MNIKKTLTKYSVLLLVYVVLNRFVNSYGLQIYYTFHTQPEMMPEDIRTIQSAFVTITFLFNLILATFILIDSKQKRAFDWLVVIITFFSAEIGIVLFLIWQIFKEINKKYEAQQKI